MSELSAELFITTVLSAAVAFVLVLCGHLLGKSEIRQTGTAAPGRLAVEIAVSNLLCCGLVMLVARYTRLSYPKALVAAAAFTQLAVPLWAGLRLRWNLKQQTQETSVGPQKYSSAAVGLTTFAVGLTTFAVWLLIWPLWLRSFQLSLLRTLFTYAANLGLSVQLQFLFVRGVMELIAFTTQRKYEATALLEDSPRVYQMRHLVAAALVALLAVWLVIVYVLFWDHGTHPRWFYMPPGAAQFAEKHGLTLPYKRGHGSILANSLPPISIVLMGLFVARRATESVSFLFSLLCLLYGLWGLEVFPSRLGIALWVIHMLAWFFIAPIQIHFFMIFPTRKKYSQGRSVRHSKASCASSIPLTSLWHRSSSIPSTKRPSSRSRGRSRPIHFGRSCGLALAWCRFFLCLSLG